MCIEQHKIDDFYRKNKDIKEIDELKGKINNQFSNSKNFRISKKVGRLKIESICFESENTIYAIPLKKPQQLMGINKKNSKIPIGIECIKNSSIPLIPYVSAVYSRNIINQLDQLKEYEKAYTLEYMLSQVYSVYIKIIEFKEVQHILIEALECFSLEKYASSISLIISLIEGISRKYCLNNNIKFCKNGSQSSFKELLKYRMNSYIEDILLFDYTNKQKYIIPTDFKYFNKELNWLLLYYDEGLNIFYSFYKYGVEYLYKSQSNYELNRHSIYHGINQDYCTKLNFYRIFSCLECLSFVITLNALGNFYGIDSNLHNEYYKKLNNMNLVIKNR